MSTHNICFHRKIRKILLLFVEIMPYPKLCTIITFSEHVLYFDAKIILDYHLISGQMLIYVSFFLSM